MFSVFLGNGFIFHFSNCVLKTASRWYVTRTPFLEHYILKNKMAAGGYFPPRRRKNMRVELRFEPNFSIP